jgi:CheY-like chemotaxis protein/HPt (histidine-containing phosphotransfer) domain-containing protein
MSIKFIERIKNRITSNENESVFNEIDIYSLIENITYSLAGKVKKDNISFVYDIAETVPRYISIDVEKLKRTLTGILNTVIEANLFREVVLEVQNKNDKLIFSIYEHNIDINRKKLTQIVQELDKENYKYIPHIRKLFDEKYTVQFKLKYKSKKINPIKFEEKMDIFLMLEINFLNIYTRKILNELGCDTTELMGVYELETLFNNLDRVAQCSYILISDEYFSEINWDIFRRIKEDYILKEKVIILNFDSDKLTSIKSFKLNYIEANPLSKYSIYNNILLYHQVVSNNLNERKNKNILIVEDNKVNAEVFIEYLKLCNLKGEVAFSGMEALARLKDAHYDMVFTDIQLPDIDGFEIARRIRASNKFIPIIAVTVQLYSGYEEEYSNAGIDEYIAKPVIFEELQRILFKYLNLTDVDFEIVKREYGDKIFEILVKNHLKFIDQYLDEFAKTIEDKDVEKIKRSAHKLKGSISNFKMSKLIRLLNDLIHSDMELQEMLKTGDLVIKEVKNLNKELRKYASESQVEFD